MTRDQQLMYCKVCKHQQMDFQRGIVCGLTGSPADFDPVCHNFFSDEPIEEVQYKASKESVTLKTPSAGKRFANYTIDLIVLIILVVVFMMVSAIVGVAIYPEAAATIESDFENYNLLISLVIHFSYYTLFESSGGRTIGKLITGTRVVDKHGRNPGVKAVFLRTISRYVPFNAFSFLGSEPRGWHDAWTDTWVIDAK
jgi:uncharacterized RDD family membrane protein YckC